MDAADLWASWDPSREMLSVFECADQPPVRVVHGGREVHVPRGVAKGSFLLDLNRDARPGASYSVPVEPAGPEPEQNPFLVPPAGAPEGSDLVRDFFRWVHGAPLPAWLSPAGPHAPHACAVPAAYMYALADYTLFPRVAARARAYLHGLSYACHGCRGRPECCHALNAFRTWFPEVGLAPVCPLVPVPMCAPTPGATGAFEASLASLLADPEVPRDGLLQYLVQLQVIAPALPGLKLRPHAPGPAGRGMDHRPVAEVYAGYGFWVPPPRHAAETAFHWVPKRVLFARLRRLLCPALWDAGRDRLDLPPSCAVAGPLFVLCLGSLPPRWTFLQAAASPGFAPCEVTLFFFGPDGARDREDVLRRLAPHGRTFDGALTFVIGGGPATMDVRIVDGVRGGAGPRTYSLCLVGTAEGSSRKPCHEDLFARHSHSLMNACLDCASGEVWAWPRFVFSMIYRIALPPPDLQGSELMSIARRHFGIPRAYWHGPDRRNVRLERFPAAAARAAQVGPDPLRPDHWLYTGAYAPPTVIRVPFSA